MTFATEKDYRDHFASVVGRRIGREQQKAREDREALAELRREVERLESELARYRKRDLGEGTPLRP